jgi:uncharacterized protein YdaU (DUF1376 family)
MSERKERMGKCLVDLPSYDSDPFVQRMTLSEEGALFRLWRALWTKTPEPGVVKADPKVLRALTRTTSEDWASVRKALRRFFDTKSRPGYWVDPRMVESYRRQNEKRAERAWSGFKGAQARWHSDGSAIAKPMAVDGGTGSGSGTGTGSGSGSDGTSTSLPLSSQFGTSKEGASPKSRDMKPITGDATSSVLAGSVRSRTRHPIAEGSGVPVPRDSASAGSAGGRDD